MCLACTASLQALYCSLECRVADRWHHSCSPECGMAWSRLLPEPALLAVRLAVLCQEEEAAGSTKQTSLAGDAFSAFQREGPHMPLSSLMSHADQPTLPEQALHRCVLAVLAADCFNTAAQSHTARKRHSTPPAHTPSVAHEELPPSCHPAVTAEAVLEWLHRLAVNSMGECLPVLNSMHVLFQILHSQLCPSPD